MKLTCCSTNNDGKPRKKSNICCVLALLVVILDRYSACAIAYGVAGNLSMSYCKALEGIFPKPDITRYDVTTNDVFHRGGFGSDRFETIFYQEKVLDVYLHLVDSSWVIVDGTKETDDVLADCFDAIAHMLENPSLVPVFV